MQRCHADPARNGLIRHDRPLSGQAYAMHAVLTGFGTAMTDPATGPLGVDDPGEALADVVAQLLEPPVAPGERAVAAAAGDTVAVFRETRDAVPDPIERSQVSAEA
ncbi:hypothetical protein [Nonomuraea sp. NPDC050691]|uniref:hypothetical protein n=1 Tax=Nonomuraea sp. NPDC050691 TaxID=3155661 RepID=UPI0033C7AFD3